MPPGPEITPEIVLLSEPLLKMRVGLATLTAWAMLTPVVVNSSPPELVSISARVRILAALPRFASELRPRKANGLRVILPVKVLAPAKLKPPWPLAETMIGVETPGAELITPMSWTREPPKRLLKNVLVLPPDSRIGVRIVPSMP